MNKKIVKFSKSISGKVPKFAVISKSDMEKKITDIDMVKVEEWYITADGRIVAVIPDVYTAIDIDK